MEQGSLIRRDLVSIRIGIAISANRQDSKMTDVYEGSLIRMFRRLEELLRQMSLASKVIGNEDLEQKFLDSLGKVKRDVVAAQSLYL
jgi:superfamily II RNA helicase